MKTPLDASIPKFLLVGVGNTLLSMVVIFLLYNVARVPPVVASVIGYLAGAVMSFFLNRHFTFQSKAALWPSALKFALNVAVLWTLTTPFLQPWLAGVLTRWFTTPALSNNLALLFSMGLYTILNYFGQRFFAFKKTNDNPKSH